MKKILNITIVLSWINGVIACIIAAIGLIMALFSTGALTLLTSVVLIAAVILHSYAAIQLHKTMVNPAIPLNKQTPTGIRFIGLAALLYALINGTNSIVSLQHIPELVKLIKLPPGAEKMPITAIFRLVAFLSLLFSASVAANVFLNLRLLSRWYKDQIPVK
jgi:hypothetical protein